MSPMLIGGPFMSRGKIDFPDPSGWTLLDFWDSRDGDLATGFRQYFLDLATFFRPNGFAWSPDGTKITFCEAGTQDKFFTFGVSTPFDPETINYSPTTQRTRLNPQRLQYSVNGGRLFSVADPSDTITEVPASNWTVSSTGIDVGNSFGVYQHGPFALSSTSDELIWTYQSGFGQPYRMRKVSFATGIANATVTQTADAWPFSVNIAAAKTVMNMDGDKFYLHQSTAGTRLITLGGTMDISSYTIGDSVNVYEQLPPGKVIYGDAIWIYPNNSRYVWFLDTLGTAANVEIQFMLYDTNAAI